MKLLLTTGVYPPRIGGPATYAKGLAEALRAQGVEVSVATYGLEHHLPVGIRHLYFLLKIIPRALTSDTLLTLDTWSVGLPTVLLGRLLGRFTIVRIGGDFLWESYVGRTGEKITLNDFNRRLSASQVAFSRKERVIFRLTKWLLKRVDRIVFSTSWQAEIWRSSYALGSREVTVIENFMGVRLPSSEPPQKNFLWPVRPIALKNGDTLHQAFTAARKTDATLVLEEGTGAHEVLQERIKTCYAVVLPSLSEVSPNLILEALRFGKPCIMTQESGYREMLAEHVLLVDPLSPDELTEKILYLATGEGYSASKARAEAFNRVHSWEAIAEEYRALMTSR